MHHTRWLVCCTTDRSYASRSSNFNYNLQNVVLDIQNFLPTIVSCYTCKFLTIQNFQSTSCQSPLT